MIFNAKVSTIFLANLHFVGLIVPCKINVEVGVNDFPATDSDGKRRRYNYEVTFLDNQDVSKVYADVILMPARVNVGHLSVETVVRVSYGRDYSSVSWSDECHYLLVGRRRLRCLVMFLGHSLEIPGAWERIGMVDGVSPKVFSTCQQQTVTVV
jgi:hypothetical protein